MQRISEKSKRFHISIIQLFTLDMFYSAFIPRKDQLCHDLSVSGKGVRILLEHTRFIKTGVGKNFQLKIVVIDT